MDLTGLAWRKARASTNNGGNCVEVAALFPGGVAVRDSKNRAGGTLSFSVAAMAAFMNDVRTGRYGL